MKYSVGSMNVTFILRMMLQPIDHSLIVYSYLHLYFFKIMLFARPPNFAS